MRGDPVYNETRMEIKDKERKRKQRKKMSFILNYKTLNMEQLLKLIIKTQ